MTWAIYPRVSTGQQVQEGYSLESQTEKCIKELKNMGINEWKIYSEEGETGEDLDRTELNKLREDIKHGLINGVICMHPDRFSRDLTNKLIVCREFENNDVKLVFVDMEFKSTPEGQLFFNMMSSLGQYELARIKMRTTSGREKAVSRDGKIMPMRSAPFGYELIEGKLIINEQEAEIVKLIYKWYVYEKLSLTEMGTKLSDMGVQPKRKESDNWCKSSISRILRSEIYIGKYIYNRRQSKKIIGERTASGNKKKTYTWRDESDWIYAEVPSIISEELYGLARKQAEENKTYKKSNTKYDYLLRSKLKCGICGKSLICTTYNGYKNKKYFVYRCNGKNPKTMGAYKCLSKTIHADKLDNAVWNEIKDMCTNPNLLKEKLGEKKNDDILLKQFELHSKLLEDKNKNREKIKKMFMLDLISENEMEKDLSKINIEIKNLQDEIKKINERIEQEKYSNEISSKVFEIMNKYKDDIINDKISYEYKRKIIEILIDRIIVKKKEDKEDEYDLGFYGIIVDIHSVPSTHSFDIRNLVRYDYFHWEIAKKI